jgi:putative transposase
MTLSTDEAGLSRGFYILAKVFCIDVCAYAIMSNHYHLVLDINKQALSALDEDRIAETVTVWRERLGSISWFMKSLNEPLARLANKVDDCKGRFWKGRFKSQALLDETSVLKCMAYVELNPIRANVAKTPETSDHTSIQARIEGRDCALVSLSSQSGDTYAIPISKEHYLNLVDWRGRHIQPDKRSSIQTNLPLILHQLQ